MKKKINQQKKQNKKAKNNPLSSTKIYILVGLLSILLLVSLFKKAETGIEKPNNLDFDKVQMIYLNATINSFLNTDLKKAEQTGQSDGIEIVKEGVSREFSEAMKNSKTEEEKKKIRAKDGLKTNLPVMDVVDKILLKEKDEPLKDYYYTKSQEFFKNNKVIDAAVRQTLSFRYYIDDLKKYRIKLESKIINYKKDLK